MEYFGLTYLNIDSSYGIDNFFHIIEVNISITIQNDTQMILYDRRKQIRSAVAHRRIDLHRISVSRNICITVTLDRDKLDRTFAVIHAHDHDNVSKTSRSVFRIFSGTAVNTYQKEVMDMLFFNRRNIRFRRILGDMNY